MSESATQLDEQPLIVGSSLASGQGTIQPSRWRDFPAPILWLLAFAPVVLLHFYNMWLRPQYQYFPFAVAAIGYLLWTRGQPIPEGMTGPIRRVRAYGLLACSFVTFLAGTVVFSPWLITIGFVLSFGATLLIMQERFQIQNALGIWLIACLLVPLPGNVDVELSQALQQMTTIVSGNLLELVYVPNIIDGTTLKLATKQLGIEEACSGIVSMMAIIASGLILAVISNRAILHTILLVVSGVAWAAVTNILRIVVLAVSQEKLQIDLSEGWRHDVLGLVLFAVALLLVVSTDRLLCFLLGAIEDESIEYVWASEFWDYVVRAFDPANESVAEKMPPKSERPWGMKSSPMLACGIAFMLLGAASVGRWGILTAAGVSSTFSPRVDEVIDRLNADSLPARFGNWKRTAFSKNHAERLFAQETRVWQYTNGEQQATFSVDFSFPEWHNLCDCYSKVGWSQNGNSVLGQTQTSEGDYLASNFYKDLSGEGVLFFSLVEDNGRPYEPPQSLSVAGQVRRRLEPDKTLFQIQLWATEQGDLSEQERAAAEKLFLECRRQMMEQIVADSPSSGGN